MATSKITKTMTKEWREFFKTARAIGWKKYFDDDSNETCAYNSEWDDSSIVQAAIRRQCGKDETEITNIRRQIFEKVLGKQHFKVNVLYVTCSYAYGGVWIYDEDDLKEQGGMSIKPRGVNDYYLIDLNKCHKIMNLWDINSKCQRRVRYAVARNQYEHMLKDNVYRYVTDWRSLPDYCMWKFVNPDGSVIPGRESAYEDYIKRTTTKADFIEVEKY